MNGQTVLFWRRPVGPFVMPLGAIKRYILLLHICITPNDAHVSTLYSPQTLTHSSSAIRPTLKITYNRLSACLRVVASVHLFLPSQTFYESSKTGLEVDMKNCVPFGLLDVLRFICLSFCPLEVLLPGTLPKPIWGLGSTALRQMNMKASQDFKNICRKALSLNDAAYQIIWLLQVPGIEESNFLKVNTELDVAQAAEKYAQVSFGSFRF